MPGIDDRDQAWGGGNQLLPAAPLGGIGQGGELRSGTVLGRYRIVGLIGRGGMGVVYRAEHTDLGMVRALKTLSPEWADHPLAQARFLKEAKAAARINHPHVVRLFDCGTHDGLPFFVMEHLEGEDLASALRRTHLTVEQTAGIMLAICAAISEMHGEGLIHRDLKPGNIFLARDKLGNIVPTVLDFGIAKPIEPGPAAVTGDRTQDGTIVGSAHYVSPEQLTDCSASTQSDQYALGVILYQCVTGRCPFEGDSVVDVLRCVSRYQFATPSAVRSDVSPEFEKVILTAMSARPTDRLPSVYHLGKALLPFASSRHQALWADFYGRERVSRTVLSTPIPVTASSAWLRPPDVVARTALLPGGSEELLLPAGTVETLPMSRRGERRTQPLEAGAVVAQGVGGTQVLPTSVDLRPGFSGTSIMEEPIEASYLSERPPGPLRAAGEQPLVHIRHLTLRVRYILIGAGVTAALALGYVAARTADTAIGGSAAVRGREPATLTETPPVHSVPATATMEHRVLPQPATAETGTDEAPQGHQKTAGVVGPASRGSPPAPRRPRPAASRKETQSPREGSRPTYPAVGRTSDSEYPAVE